jgi:protein gp37
MPTKTSIEWTDYSSGLIAAYEIQTEKRGWFCVHKSEGCRNCYAEAMNKRFGNGLAYKAQNLGKVRFEFVQKEAVALIKLNKKLAKKGQTAKVFPCDMTDIFLPEIGDEIRDKVFATFAACPNLTFQVLTKRPDVMRDYFQEWRIVDIQDAYSEIIGDRWGSYKISFHHVDWPMNR